MEYFIADPAGNITAFVFGEVDKEIAERLLSQKDTKIEQVAFLSPPQLGGDIKCDMAGGEFCGNACRAAGYYYSIKKEQGTVSEVFVEMSGAGDKPVKVTVDCDREIAFAQMPLPLCQKTIEIDGHTLPAVVFDGITHVIAPDDLIDKLELNREKLHELCRIMRTSALGVMFLSSEMHLTPLVWVDQVSSLVWESSCGSGSTACAWWLSQNMEAGHREYRFVQPGGILEIMIDKTADGCDIRMGGGVRLLGDPLIRRL